MRYGRGSALLLGLTDVADATTDRGKPALPAQLFRDWCWGFSCAKEPKCRECKLRSRKCAAICPRILPIGAFCMSCFVCTM
ncbi:hypothetical protein BKA63DRAFT_506278 [Paraphoma chrysanthemicola]|nr:hypothetical protein BKA63DRAFT_506278 [Paraphoma chrysanthemicola]